MERSIEYLGLGFAGYGVIDFRGILGQNYLLSFKDNALPNPILANFDNGNHSIVGTSAITGVSATLSFGDGSAEVWLGGSAAWASTRISGGDGDHAILVDTLAQTGAQIDLGHGNSIVQLGTAIGDVRTNITGGNGDFCVKALDVRDVTLGHGNHLINVAKASYINVGDGNSHVEFKTGYGVYNTQISAGDGNHTLIGTSLAATNLTTWINFGDGVDGAGTILQLDGPNGAINVKGGSGDHVVQIEEMSKGDISLGEGQSSDLGHDVSVTIDNVTSRYGVQVSLGGGDHHIRIGTKTDDRSSSVSAGDGNSQVEIGAARRVDLGDGDHILNVGDVASITVGDGNSQMAFDVSGVNYRNSIEAGKGSHTIIGTSTTSGTSPTYVRVGDGDITGDGSYIHLAGWHSTANIRAGDGDHTVKIDSTKQGTVSLGDGDHVIDVSAAGQNSKSSIETGDGNSNVTVNGAGNVRLGAGDHVINASDVTTIITGAGDQQIFFEDGLNYSSTGIYTRGSGDDVVVGLGLDERPKARIETYDGDDTIVLLNGNWSGTSIRGGSGFDTLYVDERAKDSLSLNSIENVVYLSSDLSTEAALMIAGVSHPDYATAQNSVQAWDNLVEAPQGIEVQPIELLDIARKDFNLVALPDQESPAGAKLQYVEVAGNKTTDGGAFDPASREDRLMESTFDFFQRVEAYETSASKNAFDAFFSIVHYNEFGDLNGTNSADAIQDTGEDSQIFAMGGDDTIDGSLGQDRIYGGKGNDVVRGGAGQDLLDGGDGYDVLIGGDDIDIFVFRKGEGTTDIQDFELSIDILDVEGFDNLTYEDLTSSGQQVGADVFYELGDDTLILRGAELAMIIEIDLCMR